MGRKLKKNGRNFGRLTLITNSRHLSTGHGLESFLGLSLCVVNLVVTITILISYNKHLIRC